MAASATNSQRRRLAIWLPERSQARAIRQQRQARVPKEIYATDLPEFLSSAKLLT
jgi:hypothetical protein